MPPLIPRKASASRCLRILTVALSLLAFLAGSPLPAQVGSENGRTSFYRGKLAVSANFPSATVGTAYSAVVSVGGGTAPYRFSSGDVPPGLVLNHKSGSITGTPTQAGDFTFRVRVEDAAGDLGFGEIMI